MKTKDILANPPSTWIPEQNLGTLALLGKSGEECCELGAKLCRAIIQGVFENDPETFEPNILAIQDEIADVRGVLKMLSERLELDNDYISNRAALKIKYKQQWIIDLDNMNL